MYMIFSPINVSIYSMQQSRCFHIGPLVTFGAFRIAGPAAWGTQVEKIGGGERGWGGREAQVKCQRYDQSSGRSITSRACSLL